VLFYVQFKDYKCITQQVSNVVDDGYKIKVFTSAEFKVFPQHLLCKINYKNRPIWVNVMKRNILFVLLSLSIFCFACMSHDFDKKRFENVNRAAHAVKDSVKAGADIQQFENLLQELSAEILALKDKVKSEKEKELLKDYSNLLAIYYDGFTLWKYKNEFTRYGFVPKGLIYVGQDVEPIVERYNLKTESHIFNSTKQLWKSIPESSIQIIWMNADSQMKIIDNILNY